MSARRERLLNAPALVIMSASVLLALFVLFPRQPAFRDPANLNAKDALSIAYLRVLVQADPQNHPLRLSFVQLLTEAGEDEEAVQALAPLKTAPPERLRFEIGLADVRLSLQRLYRRNLDEAGTAALSAQITAAFQQLLPLAATGSERQALAVEAERFGAPSVMALLTEQLAARASLPAEQAKWWAEAGRHRLANGEPQRAGEHYRRAFTLETDKARQQQLAPALLQAFLASGDLKAALASARDTVAALPEDDALLLLAISVAEQGGDQPLAYRWLQRLQRRQADDRALAERTLRKALSLGRLDDALPLSRKLAAGLSPSATDARALALRQLLARSFDWNSAWPEALEQWYWLAMRAPDAENEARAFALAKSGGDDARALALIEAAMSRRALSDEEVSHYRLAGLRSGEPSRLTSRLDAYLSAHPHHRAAWRELAAIRTAEGESALAARAFARAADGSQLDAVSRLQQAEALRDAGEPAAALDLLLASGEPAEGNRAADYWRLRADLAWALERDALAGEASEHLLQHYAAGDRQAIDRLLSLARLKGDGTAIVRWARYGWQQTGERDYLIVLMDRAWQRGDWPQLDALMSEATAAGGKFDSHPRYWQYRAEQAQRAADYPAALAALKRMLTGRAFDTEALETYLWALLAAEPLPRAELVQMVEQFAPLAAGSPHLAEAFAATYLQLGQAQQATPLFRQSLLARRDDPVWRLLVADNLEWLGCVGSANRLRFDTLEWLQTHAAPLPAYGGDDRLADRFFGRRDVAAVKVFAEPWQLFAGADANVAPRLDNARQFALRWLNPRLSLPAWRDVADSWRNADAATLMTLIDNVRERLLIDLAGATANSVLPMTLNDVAARVVRSSSGPRSQRGRNRTVTNAPGVERRECLSLLDDLGIGVLKAKLPAVPEKQPAQEKSASAAKSASSEKNSFAEKQVAADAPAAHRKLWVLRNASIPVRPEHVEGLNGAPAENAATTPAATAHVMQFRFAAPRDEKISVRPEHVEGSNGAPAADAAATPAANTHVMQFSFSAPRDEKDSVRPEHVEGLNGAPAADAAATSAATAHVMQFSFSAPRDEKISVRPEHVEGPNGAPTADAATTPAATAHAMQFSFSAPRDEKISVRPEHVEGPNGALAADAAKLATHFTASPPLAAHLPADKVRK